MLLNFTRQGLARVLVGARASLPQGRLFRSAALLTGSTLLIQIVALCLAPVYARLYSPSDYGVFGQFYSIVNALLIIASLCFELAIPTAKDAEEALSLVVLSLTCMAVITFLSLLWAAALVWRAHGNLPEHGLHLLLVPAGVLFSGCYRITQYWAIRVQALKAIAGTLIKQMVGGQVINLSFALLHPTPLGLVLGQIVSSSAGVGSLSQASNLVSMLKTHRAVVFRRTSLCAVARKYRQYALMQCPSSLLNSLGLYLPGMMMLPCFGAAFAGQFNISQRIGRIPISLVGSSVSQVFFSEAASVARTDPGRVRSLFNSISRKLAIPSVLVLIACLLAPIGVPIVFGRRWLEAGELTMWLGFGLALQLWVSPLSNIPNVVGKLKGQLVIDAIRAVLVFGAFYLPYRLALPGKWAVIIYSGVLVLNYIACYLLYRNQLMALSRQVAQSVSLLPETLAIESR